MAHYEDSPEAAASQDARLEGIKTKRIETINKILSVIKYDEQMPDKILWSSDSEGLKDTHTIYFTIGAERKLLLLQGGDYATYLDYSLKLCSIEEGHKSDFDWWDSIHDGQGWNKCEVIHDFEEGTTESEAKAWAEAWLLEYLKSEGKKEKI